MVTVSRVDKAEEKSFLENVSADFVEVTIKDQFISRGEMHFFQKSLVGRWIYESERLSDAVQVRLRKSWILTWFHELLIRSLLFQYEDWDQSFRTRNQASGYVD